MHHTFVVRLLKSIIHAIICQRGRAKTDIPLRTVFDQAALLLSSSSSSSRVLCILGVLSMAEARRMFFPTLFLAGYKIKVYAISPGARQRKSKGILLRGGKKGKLRARGKRRKKFSALPSCLEPCRHFSPFLCAAGLPVFRRQES